MTKAREHDLQDRLIDYAVRVVKLFEALAVLRAPGRGTGDRSLALGVGYSLLDIGYSIPLSRPDISCHYKGI